MVVAFVACGGEKKNWEHSLCTLKHLTGQRKPRPNPEQPIIGCKLSSVCLLEGYLLYALT